MATQTCLACEREANGEWHTLAHACEKGPRFDVMFIDDDGEWVRFAYNVSKIVAGEHKAMIETQFGRKVKVLEAQPFKAIDS